MARTFSTANRGVRGRRVVMNLSDLNEPISLVRGVKSPDEGADWDFTVTPYVETWAAVDESSVTLQGRQNADHKSVHLFVIRQEPHFSIEASDFVVWQNAFYQLLSMQPIKGAVDYLELRTAYYSSADKAGHTVDPSGPKPAPESMSTNQPLFWS